MPLLCAAVQIAALFTQQLMGMWYRRTASERAATEARTASMQGACFDASSSS